VHGVNIAKSSYQCTVPQCRIRAKVWPRLDNFKQHLLRMHPDVDPMDLIHRYLPRSSQLARKLANPYRSANMPNQADDTQVDLAPNPDLNSIPQTATHEIDRLRASGNYRHTVSTGERSAFNRDQSPFVLANDFSTSPFKDGSPYKPNSISIAHSSQSALDATLTVSEFGPSRSPSLQHHELNRSAEGPGSPSKTYGGT
jgi:hypothetical protein